MSQVPTCVVKCFLLVYFFFSSRGRHTRFKWDGSSDVCSSDLPRYLPWCRHIVVHRADTTVDIGAGSVTENPAPDKQENDGQRKREDHRDRITDKELNFHAG